MKSVLANRLDGAITPIRVVLAQAGFRARNRTFNRRLESGIVHVVQVTMGRSDPPGTAEIPGYRRNWYGTFTVDLGVYVPEVAKYLLYWQRPKLFPGEIDCCIRRNLGELWPVAQRSVWNVEEPAGLYGELSQHLERYAMPFFARHADRRSIVEELKGGPGYGIGGAPRVIAAVIMRESGSLDEARRLLREQDELVGKPGHSDYLRELTARLQLD